MADGEPLRPREREAFEWGYEGASPLALSLALLRHHLGDQEKAERLAAPFMREVVANLGNEWQVSAQDIDFLLKAIAAQPTARSKA